MSGPRAVSDLLAVWLRSLPLHESKAFNDLALSLAFAKEKAESLPPSIDRRCAALINTKLEEAEHWALAALRAAVDRSDREHLQGLGRRWCLDDATWCTAGCNPTEACRKNLAKRVSPKS